MERDTIAAPATASGPGAIAIIRVSGPDSLALADRIFRGPAPRPSERPGGIFLHGRIVQPGTGDGGGQTADDALLLIFRAPRSYSGEDMVEIHCHGGRHMPQRVLHVVLAAGARPAEPGEFSRRAFLNGKMDLTQAEAVADLIGAATDRAARAALEQLQGRLRRRIDVLYDNLMQAAASLEATLDFPDDELPPPAAAAVTAGLEVVRRDIQSLLATWTEGHLLRDGLRVVISGSPNVGKSTLLNSLLGRDRAIVSPVPGTTRDVIEENLALDGILLRLTDTAGLRVSDCAVEREGVRRSRAQMEAADLHLHVVDASRPLTPAERTEAAALPAADTLVVLNKIDLPVCLAESDLTGFRRVRTSLLHGRGLDELRTAIAAHLAERAPAGAAPQAVIAERHRLLLQETAARVEAALTLWGETGEDQTACAATELRAAAQSLGAITGRVYHDELLDRIFSRFCIGK